MTSPQPGSSQNSQIQSGNDPRDSGNKSKEKDKKDDTQASNNKNKATKKPKSTSANLPTPNSKLNRNESNNSEIKEQRLSLPDKTKKGHKKSGFSILAGLSRFLVGEKLPTVAESKQLSESKVETVRQYRDAAVQTSELKLNKASTLNAIATAIDKLKEVRKRAEILEKKVMDDRNNKTKDDNKGIDESKGIPESDKKQGDSYAELTPDSEIIDDTKDDVTSQEESDVSIVGPDITELVKSNSHPQSSSDNNVQKWRNSQFSEADKDSFLFPPGFVPEIMPESPDTTSERESEMEEPSESSVQTGSFSNSADSVSYDGHASFGQVSSFTTQETSTPISKESHSINDMNDISQNSFPKVLAILSRDHQTQTSPNKLGKTIEGRSFDEHSPPLTGRAEPLAIVPSPRHKNTSPATPAPTPVPMSSLLEKSTPQAMFQQTIIEDRANCAKCELFEYMLKHGGEEILQDENMHRTFKKHMDYHVHKATQEMKKIYKWAEKISEAEESSNNESYIFPGTTHTHEQREQVKTTRNQSSNTEHHHHHKHNLQQGGNEIERTSSDQIRITQENGTQHSSSQLDNPKKHHKSCHPKKHDNFYNSHHKNAVVDEDECSSSSSSDSEREKKHAYCSCHTQGRNNYCYNYCAKRQCNQRQCFYYWDWNSYFDKCRPTSAAPYACCCKVNNGNDNCVKVKESCHTHKRNGSGKCHSTDNGEIRRFSTHYSDCDVVSDDDNNDAYNCDDSTETGNDDITRLVAQLKCLMSEAIKTLRNDEPGRGNKGRKTNGGESTTGRNETDEKKSGNRSGADNKKEPGTALESSSLQTESPTGTDTAGRRHSTLDGDSIMDELADFLTSFRGKESSSEMKRQQDMKNKPTSSTNKMNKQVYNIQGNASPGSNENSNVDNRRDPQVEDVVAQIMAAFCTQCHNQNQDGHDSTDPEATSTTTESTQTIKHAVTHSYFYPITQDRGNNDTCCATGASYLHYDCNLNSSRPTSNHYRRTDSAESRQGGNNGSSANEEAFRRHNRQVCYERINMRQSSCFSNSRERRETMRNLEDQRPRCKPASSRRPNTAPTAEQRRDDSSVFCGTFSNNPTSATISRLCSPHQHAFTYFVPKEKMYWQCYNL